jgi:flagellar biosynthetic protein FliP
VTTIQRLAPLLLLAGATAPAVAAPARVSVNGIGGGANVLGVPMQVVVVLTALTLLPAVIMAATPFLRITLALHFLRQAIGTQTAPSNQVLLGLALFLTIVLMRPVISEIHAAAWIPFERGELSGQQAIEKATPALKKYLARFVREKDVAVILQIAKQPAPRNAEDLDLDVLVPAYVLSELKTGFQIGAVLFLPFLIIDLVVASVTLSIGMVQLPPVMISAPFKILLFVLVDGWNLVVGSLVKSMQA